MSVVDWSDGVTPLNAANLDTLESIYRKGQVNGYAGLDAVGKVPVAQLPAMNYVPLDGVQVAGTRILASKLVGTDAQPAFRIMGDGKHEWGLGGATAPDVNLYRTAAPNLSLITNANLRSEGSVYSKSGLASMVALSEVSGQAGILFGSAFDTNLYRPAANQLKTDDDFYIGTNRLAVTAATGALNWGDGTAFDTYLRREAVSTLKTGGLFRAGSNLFARDGFAEQVNIGAVSGVPGIAFGSAGDTNLYRSGADSLKTDDSLTVAGQCYIEGDCWIKNDVGNWLFITGNDGGGGGFPASFPASIVVNLNGSVYKIPLV